MGGPDETSILEANGARRHGGLPSFLTKFVCSCAYVLEPNGKLQSLVYVNDFYLSEVNT
jgi:hypothetical protein